VPEISRFLGIIISMYYDEHAPPHFHAKYQGFEIQIEIHSGVVEGKFPRRALRAVLDWYEIYREALIYNWELAREHKPLLTIAPLE
jgi:hypothetical protein